MDERFVMHRYYSTRLALIAGMVIMAVWINYELFVNHRPRWDLLIIMGGTLLVKVGARLYYRFTN